MLLFVSHLLLFPLDFICFFSRFFIFQKPPYFSIFSLIIFPNLLEENFPSNFLVKVICKIFIESFVSDCSGCEFLHLKGTCYISFCRGWCWAQTDHLKAGNGRLICGTLQDWIAFCSKWFCLSLDFNKINISISVKNSNMHYDYWKEVLGLLNGNKQNVWLRVQPSTDWWLSTMTMDAWNFITAVGHNYWSISVIP